MKVVLKKALLLVGGSFVLLVLLVHNFQKVKHSTAVLEIFGGGSLIDKSFVLLVEVGDNLLVDCNCIAHLLTNSQELA